MASLPFPPIFGPYSHNPLHCPLWDWWAAQTSVVDPEVLSISNLWYCMSRAGKRGRRSSAGSLDSNMEVSWKQLVSKLISMWWCALWNTPFILVLHLLCFIDSVHLFGSFLFLPGMPYNLLASVSVHAWDACLWSCPFVGSQGSPVLVMLYDQYTLYLRTRMTATNASLDPSPCRLSLSFIKSQGFHLVPLFGRVVALKYTRNSSFPAAFIPFLGSVFLFFLHIHNFS